MLGRYIDGLPNEVKDRIIRAQEWRSCRPGGESVVIDVVAQVEAATLGSHKPGEILDRWGLRLARALEFGVHSRSRLQRRCSRMMRRVGEARAVSLLKCRAARKFTPRFPQNEPERW